MPPPQILWEYRNPVKNLVTVKRNRGNSLIKPGVRVKGFLLLADG